MNKRKVDALLPAAVEVCKKHQLTHEFRGQISSFGSAVACGSLLAAVAFFSSKGNCSVDRSRLMKAINEMLKTEGLEPNVRETLFETVRGAKNRSAEIKENILCCAVAIKLALNLFPPEGGGDA